MKYHVESCHLIKFVAFRVNRDQIMDLEKLKKLKTNQFLSNGRVVNRRISSATLKNASAALNVCSFIFMRIRMIEATLNLFDNPVSPQNWAHNDTGARKFRY